MTKSLDDEMYAVVAVVFVVVVDQWYTKLFCPRHGRNGDY
jgi:hypothetical protein